MCVLHECKYANKCNVFLGCCFRKANDKYTHDIHFFTISPKFLLAGFAVDFRVTQRTFYYVTINMCVCQCRCWSHSSAVQLGAIRVYGRPSTKPPMDANNFALM